MRRLLEGLPGGQRFGTFAGTAVVVAVVVAAVAVVAVGSAAAAVAVAAAGMGCGFPASHTPSPVAVAPAKRAERRPGSGGSSHTRPQLAKWIASQGMASISLRRQELG